MENESSNNTNTHLGRMAKTEKNIPGVILSITVSDTRPGGVNSVCPTSVSR